MSIKKLDSQYVANTYARFPVEIVKGKGSLCWDDEGREYIDLGAGIAVNTFGFADEEWAAAVTGQLMKFQHTSNLYYSEPCVRLAEMLCKRTGMAKVFFSNSGAEANECAIKVARKYAAEKKGADCYNIITLVNSFHGRTLTTLAATGQDAFHHDFLPLTPGFLYAEPNDLAGLEKLMSENKVAGLLMECVQGEGGVIALDEAFIKGAAELAAKHDVILMIDEVQTGNGRTGQLYAYMNYGIKPDVFSTAKGLAGGLPMGATVLGEKLADVFTPGSHGSTFGGNPVVCAGAVNTLSRIDEACLAGVRERSKLVFDTLSGAKGVKSLSGLGLMLGIETEKDAGAVIAKCLERGVMPIKAKNKVRLVPALNIPIDLLKKALEVIKTACGEE